MDLAAGQVVVALTNQRYSIVTKSAVASGRRQVEFELDGAVVRTDPNDSYWVDDRVTADWIREGRAEQARRALVDIDED
jgi:hypothetical protein